MIAAALAIALAGWPAPQAIFANSYAGQGLPFGRANTVDLTSIAPPNAVAVAMSGMLIISHGTNQETCDLRVWFRPDESARWGDYRGQTVEAHLGGGQRSNHSIVVPMKDRKFQVWFDPAGTPQWPQGCSYGVNYKVDYWVVNE